MKLLKNNRLLRYILLLIIYIPILLIILFWPIGPAIAFVKGQLLHQQTCSLGICYHCGPGARVIDYIFFSSLAIGLWWAILGAFCCIWPKAVVNTFRPFADGFTRKHAIWMMVIGILIAVLFAGALWQSSGQPSLDALGDCFDNSLSCFALA